MKVKKRKESIIEILKKRFLEKEGCVIDWRAPIREALLREESGAEWKILREYVFMKGETYHRMTGGILSRFVGCEEAKRKLEEVHSKSYRFCREISLYCRLQRTCFYWQDMNKEADQV